MNRDIRFAKERPSQQSAESFALAGHFYAVGVGPGDSDLLTLRAARLIESADVILAPQSQKSTHSLALNAAKPFLSGQELVVTRYPMQRDSSATQAHWRKIAEDVARRCSDGQAVVQITLGDPLVFATSSCLTEALADKLNPEQIHLVPGISAFQLVASCFQRPLALQEDRLLIMSATDLEAVEQALDQCETLVLFKAAGNLPALLELLRKHDLLQRASLVSAGGQGKQELQIADLSRWEPNELGYMTTMIIHLGQRPWQEQSS
ncbi:precorrin-2 C(20)-methyltransferase [Trichloromonas sp.]|uniref:precorrin-2 C(20)-methyltransferase n=1 Tax=Trichloromonas sp. TaxID=3069249 RepID=UPI001E0CD6E3|nr:precorrin-2 C(20)-methyltransferase [Desulfuromonadaceae bacterium]MDY0269858.1 precorrin-2 C(20)-methyltransferase [Trichloromonas sp.]